MDIGLKYINEDEFYLYNNETPRKQAKGGRDSDRVLGKGTYYVRARFRCKGVDMPFWFILENLSKGKEVTFKSVPQPKSHKEVT